MKNYVAAYAASMIKGSCVQVDSGFTIGRDRDGAFVAAYNGVRKRYPSSEGWSAPNLVLSDVTPQVAGVVAEMFPDAWKDHP